MPSNFSWRGFSGSQEESFSTSLRQITNYASKVVNDRMEEIMTKVQKDAIKMAPVDQGNLENSIKLEKSFQRRNWVVYIDEDAAGTGRDSVGQYAAYMHEGVYNLGPKSMAKQATVDVVVGPKFLTRAFDSNVNDQTIRDLQQLLDDSLESRKVTR